MKTTKPFWVSIVLSAWGAERDQAGLFVRASDSRREEHSSRQRISAPISSTTSWSCQKEGGCLAQSPHSSHLLFHNDFMWLPDPQKSVPTIFADGAHMGLGGCVCTRTSFLSHCTQGCGCCAGQTKCVTQLSSFAAAFITHNCSLLVFRDFCGLPLLTFFPVLFLLAPSTPSPQWGSK